MKHILVLLLATFALSSLCTAQVPQIINYQGRVAVGGKSFNGVGQFNFSFINADGSQTYWASNDVAINVAAGLFTVRLGDTSLGNMTALTSDIFTDPAHGDVRLRVAFNDGTHGFQIVSPDTRMLAVPYAVAAKTAVTAKTADFGFPANAQEYTSAGTSSFTVPAGVTKILAEVWGAGGGAGILYAGATGYNSQLAACGAYSRKVISVTPGEILNVFVGQGGAAAVSNIPGGTGEASFISRPAIDQGGDATTLLISEGGGGYNNGNDLILGNADPSAQVGRASVTSYPYQWTYHSFAIAGTVAPPQGLTVPNYNIGSLPGGAGYVLLQW